MTVVDAFRLGLATALATGLGVVPVYLFDVEERGLGFMWGLSGGLMATISVIDLLVPVRDTPVALGVGAVAGVAFVLVAARLLHDHNDDGHAHDVGGSPLSTLTLLMFLVFTVHSAPEGVGIGSALKRNLVTGLVVVLAIAVHNIPEGMAVGVGMRADGVSMVKAEAFAVITSLPQPLLAPIVFVVAVGPLLPAGMAFAGGAMLALVGTEMREEGMENHPRGFIVGALVGVALGVTLNVLLPVPGGL